MNDLRFAFRMLLKSPGSTVVVVLTLALGIGANTAIFSIVNAVLLRPLPYLAPEQLVQVQKKWQRSWADQPRVGSMMGVPETLAWLEGNPTLCQIAAYQWQGMNLAGGDEPERVDCGRVSASFLPLLDASLTLGRGFLPEDDRPGAAPVAILSHGLWRRRFGGDTNVLRRSITLDAKSHTVVGVLAPAFRFAERYDLCIPLALRKGEFAMPSVIGRLKPGVGLEQARTALDAVYQEARDQEEKGRVVLVNLQENLVGGVRRSLLLYLGAVGFVLLIACVNVANLLLARAVGRQKEMSIRLALGASRSRVMRQLLTESLVLSLFGAGLGLVLAFWIKDLVGPAIAHTTLSPSFQIDGLVLAFTVVLALLTGVLFGLAPAWVASRSALGDSLKEGSRTGGSGGRHQHRLSGFLVASEVTLAMVLLAGAGLLLQSYVRLRGVDPGFRPDRILSLTIVLSKPSYPDGHSQVRYFEQVLERLRDLPGVEAVGANVALPLTPIGFSVRGLEIDGQPAAEERAISAGVVNGDYFRAMGIPLKRGRAFADSDRDGAPSVVLVNESFVKRYLAGKDPIGKRLGRGADAATVVGVVGDVRQHGLTEQFEPQVFRSYLQSEDGVPCMSLAVRTRGDPMKLVEAVRRRIQSVDKDQPVYSVMTLEQRLADTLLSWRVNMWLSSALSALALGLAMLGLYGVLSFSVAQRRHDIGVRMALGAQTHEVLALVIRQGLKLTGLGVIAGLLASFALTRLLAGWLYGVSALDPATFLGASVLLTGVTLAACYLPARQAAKVDPMVALRCE